MKITWPKDSPLQNALHILILFAVGVAHPVLDLTARNPAFYVARQSDGADLIFLVLILCFISPFVLLFIESLLGLTKGAPVFHAFLILVFSAAIILPALKEAGLQQSEWAIPVSLILAAALTWIYVRYKIVRSSLTYLSPVVLIVPLLFFLNPRINRIVVPPQYSLSSGSIQKQYPVVMVVFDELPLKSLVDENGNIDRVRYPNFAMLADTSIWFRNATTVATDTIEAIPAILTGSFPEQGLLPNRIDYPRNVINLLQGKYRQTVIEFITAFSNAPPADRDPWYTRLKLMLLDMSAIYLHHLLPIDQKSRLPVITQTWGDFWLNRSRLASKTSSLDDRSQLFHRFLSTIRKAERPGFHYLHIMLPHVPWEYFPSGTHYNMHGIGYFGVDGLTSKEVWVEDPVPIRLSLQRHLLQVAFVDRLLGDLMKTMKSEEIWEESVLIVLADHGSSFQMGKRRGVSYENYSDIMRIPFFMKLPGQNSGSISDTNAQTIDVLPTLQSILKIDSQWKVDGRSLLKEGNGPEWKTIFYNGERHEFPAGSTILHGYDDSQIAMLPVNGDWTGKRLQQMQYAGEAPVEIVLHNADAFESVNPGSGHVPALITAHISTGETGAGNIFGVVVNGVLAAVTRSFRFGNERSFISSLVPENSFRQGANEIEIVMLNQNRKGEYYRPRLIRKSGRPPVDYQGKI